MDEQGLLACAAAVAMALTHLFSGRIRLLDGVPRSRWLSAFGGISVAYVFVHLLPELASGQEAIEEREEHVYLVALAGLAVFYGVESHSLASRRRNRDRSGQDRTHEDAFWLSIASFAAYNLLVGYLLLREELDEASALALYAFAMTVHFVVNDSGLREHHEDAYDRVGRWVIAGAILVGWVFGVTIEIPERVIALVLAFIGGGVILNVMKEELPGERQARLLPFLSGAAGYAALLQLV